MPLYSYRCQCGHTEDAYRIIDKRHEGPECHGVMELVIVPTLKYVDHMKDGYKCVVTDQHVTSRKERREIMKRHNLIEAG